MGKTHIVWDSINNSVRDVRKAITKARMLTGTYMLQTLKSKFNQACLQGISLIETFSLIAIWWTRLSCLLCSSADIGNIPNNRYTAEFAVLIGEIPWRQYNAGRPASFFIKIVDILDLYELPPFTEVMSGHFKKFERFP
jgi:hypothetical protein